jgi:lipopolysaccharide/colanic/teichoic acid biosynthesis glycosyltransferase
VAASTTGATGAVLSVGGALSGARLNQAIRDAQAAGLHVHVSSGIARIDRRRLRVVPLSHEPFLYLEPPAGRSWEEVSKRLVDIAASATALVVLAPAFAMCALAIAVTSRGPVLHRQVRIGRGGRPFTLHKLRTMVVGAEDMIDLVADRNERTGGPLFKVDSDPRVTTVGRILRATSLDELPQLWDVLVGTMSLVGPRPAFPDEVARFDDELRRRHDMRPGITGLWQVEARDNPCFHAYRRLDLFYVDNWSLLFDLAILLQTVPVVVGRAIASLRRRTAAAALAARVDLDLS